MVKNVDGKLYINLDTGQDIIDCLVFCDNNTLDFKSLKNISQELGIPALQVRNDIEDYIEKARDKIEEVFELGQICTPSPWCPFKNVETVIYINNPNMISHIDIAPQDYRNIDFNYVVEKTEYYTLYCYKFKE